MAVPTDYIFTSGTCLKSALYDLIISTLKAAGWTDVSSLASSDYVVLTSTGNTADKKLILNLRDTNASAANSVVSTDYCAMSYRLQTSYIAGATGVAGTFGRSSLAWTNLYIAPVAALTATLAAGTTISYKIYADASKLILTIEYPSASGLSPQLIYMGEPDSLYCGETGNSGMLVACSSNANTASNATICDSPDGIASVSSPYAIPLVSLIPSKNPNNSNKFFVSDIYASSTTEGVRSKLDGIYCALNSNLLTGDTVTIGTYTYYALVCASVNSNSFPSLALLVRTA